MELGICAQDIRSVSFGLIDKGSVIAEEVFEASPEQYLRILSEFLQKYDCSLDSLTRLFVVTGPGSFTASRVSVTIANTLAFSLGIPLSGVENQERSTFEKLWYPMNSEGEHDLVVPVYDRPPMIT